MKKNKKMKIKRNPRKSRTTRRSSTTGAKPRKVLTLGRTTTGGEKQIAKIIRGMQDVLPAEEKIWDYFFEKAKKLAKNFGFVKINTPILEECWIFKKGAGETAEIIKKQMYDFFERRGEVKLALRPDFVPSIARAYIDNGMFNLPQPVKLYYSGPVFRYEKLEHGRYHQFHKFGLQIIGSDKPVTDAELVIYADSLFKNLGFKVKIEINDLGCSRCRSFYRKKLYNFLKKRKKYLCSTCQENLEKNSLNVLKCKENNCQDIIKTGPQIINSLCDRCEDHFHKYLEYLDGAEITYHLNPYLIRGLDYYNGPIFEVYSTLSQEKFQSLPEEERQFLKNQHKTKGVKLSGGGRSDKLIEILGGRSTPACGAGFGAERIIEELKGRKIKVYLGKRNPIFLARIGDAATVEALKIKKLLTEEFMVVDNLSEESLTAQLETASKLNLKFILIIGNQEVLDKTIIIRNLATGAQEVISQEKMINGIKKRLKEK